MAGKYQPCNGSEGDWFTGQFCDQCAHDAGYRETNNGSDGCQILMLTLCHNVTDKEYPEEWTYDKNGKPTCTKYLHESESIQERCTKTQDMFGI